MAAVHAEPAKKGPKRPRTAQSAADDWERFLDETLEGAKRYNTKHSADVKAGDFVDLPEDKHAEIKHDGLKQNVKYEKGGNYCIEFRVQLMDGTKSERRTHSSLRKQP